jgi:hypothetical protein
MPLLKSAASPVYTDLEMNVRPHIAALIGALLLMPALIVPGQALSVDDAEGWERSAINRNDNAIALEEEVEALLESAAGYRDREYLYDAERRANLKRAGESELRAGELGAAAATHYEKAADNWSRAEDVYGTLQNAEQQENAEMMVTSARKSARLALTQAIGCFEAAKDAFGESNAADEPQRRAANEKAEAARSRLAELLQGDT